MKYAKLHFLITLLYFTTTYALEVIHIYFICTIEIL